MLQIAPEHQIARRIEQNKLCHYYTGDIMPGRAKYVVDVTKMQFGDGMFDYIIMNHVLEHIPDEALAISELKRCLKPGGTLILSFPVCSDRKTFEDTGIVSDEDRLRYYGQTDHCRLYGTDCRDHLEQYGLEVTPYIVKETLDSKTIRKMALIPDDIAFFCTKK
ncbi:class I SAM-dependent methyltransferase [Blautia wexlerae]|nr:class I SAM-dependent methyltransferase [Blautia wexlerae]